MSSSTGHVVKGIYRLVEDAQRAKQNKTTSFHGISVTARPGSNPDDLYRQWWQRYSQNRAG
jgi:hypothetical protein